MAIQYFDKHAIITIDGNLSTEEEIKKLVYESDEATSNHIPHLVLNFKNVKEIGSAGMAKILQIYKTQQAFKSKLYITNIGEEIEGTLKSMMFFNLIQTFKSEEDISF